MILVPIHRDSDSIGTSGIRRETEFFCRSEHSRYAGLENSVSVALNLNMSDAVNLTDLIKVGGDAVMAFADKVRQYVLRHTRELGIGCGIWMILMGVYILMIATNASRGYIFHPGVGYILLGISFVTMNLLEWRLVLMLTCTVVALGLALWIIVFKPGDHTPKHAVSVQQGVMEEASKPNTVPDEAASPTR